MVTVDEQAYPGVQERVAEVQGIPGRHG